MKLHTHINVPTVQLIFTRSTKIDFARQVEEYGNIKIVPIIIQEEKPGDFTPNKNYSTGQLILTNSLPI
jgi:hypothetical protein